MSLEGDDGYVYHYTGARGLLGIFESRKIWATQSGYLNDGNDCRVIDNLLSAQLQSKVLGMARDVSDRHLAALQSNLNRGRVTFVSSFSKVPNSLTQFRMYSPQAGGYVVGFPRSLLEKMGTLVEVNYDSGHHGRWSRQFLSEYCREAENIDDGAIDIVELSFRVDAVGGFLERRIAEGIKCKSKEFAQEQEVRLVHHGTTTHVRASPNGSLLIPYVELDIPDDDVVVRVAAGPGRYQNSIAREGIFNLVHLEGLMRKNWSLSVLSIGESSHRESF